MPHLPPRSKQVSAGLVMWRPGRDGQPEVLLAHPGGPFYRGKDAGVWTIPKGLVEPGEVREDAARREFAEEAGLTVEPTTALVNLGKTQLKSRKTIHAWACEAPAGLADPALTTLPLPESTPRNTYAREWPPHSGKWLRYAEIDRLEFFAIPTALGKVHEAQRVFLERLARWRAGDEPAAGDADGQSFFPE